MAEYIDKQKALAAIEAEREYMTRRQEWLAEHILTHCGYRMVADMPAADVETVRRGRWELIDGAEPRRYGCSVCKRLSWDETNYCSNCGARMEE